MPRAIAILRFSAWLEEAVLRWAEEMLHQKRAHRGILGLAAAGLAIVFLPWLLISALRMRAAEAVLEVPGGHQWASQWHDAEGSRWTNVTGPAAPPLILWTFNDADGFAGGPAVSASGTLYVNTLRGRLYAVDPSGKVLWVTQRPSGLVGTPALGADGRIYVTDMTGSLNAFDSQGELVWQVTPGGAHQATSGPVIAADGTLYYTTSYFVQAVSAEGKALWQTSAASEYLVDPPVVSPDGKYVFLREAAMDAHSGTLLPLRLVDGNQVLYTWPVYLVGADGKLYFRAGNELNRWQMDGSQAKIVQRATWEDESFGVAYPKDTGVTRDGRIWMFYADESSDTRLVWLTMQSELIRNMDFPERVSWFVGLDKLSNAYFCGSGYDGRPKCTATNPDAEKPLWQIALEGTQINGGAVVENRIYVTTVNGRLFAIGDPTKETVTAPAGVTVEIVTPITSEATKKFVPVNTPMAPLFKNYLPLVFRSEGSLFKTRIPQMIQLEAPLIKIYLPMVLRQ